MRKQVYLSEVRVAIEQDLEVRRKGVCLEQISRHRFAGPGSYRSRCPLRVAVVSKVGAKVAAVS